MTLLYVSLIHGVTNGKAIIDITDGKKMKDVKEVMVMPNMSLISLSVSFKFKFNPMSKLCAESKKSLLQQSQLFSVNFKLKHRLIKMLL